MPLAYAPQDGSLAPSQQPYGQVQFFNDLDIHANPRQHIEDSESMTPEQHDPLRHHSDATFDLSNENESRPSSTLFAHHRESGGDTMVKHGGTIIKRLQDEDKFLTAQNAILHLQAQYGNTLTRRPRPGGQQPKAQSGSLQPRRASTFRSSVSFAPGLSVSPINHTASRRDMPPRQAATLATEVAMHRDLPPVQLVAGPSRAEQSKHDLVLENDLSVRTVGQLQQSFATARSFLPPASLQDARRLHEFLLGGSNRRYIAQMLGLQGCQWTVESPVVYACQMCTDFRMPCLVVASGNLRLLPLHPLVRPEPAIVLHEQSAGVKADEFHYWVAPKGKHCDSFPTRPHPGVWQAVLGGHQIAQHAEPRDCDFRAYFQDKLKEW